MKPDLSPSAPDNPHVHLFETEHGPHVFVVNGSKVYGIGQETKAALAGAVSAENDGALDALLRGCQLDGPSMIGDAPPSSPPVRSLSLAVAQKCNLGCTYCYAQQGSFGGAPKSMSLESPLPLLSGFLPRRRRETR